MSNLYNFLKSFDQEEEKHQNKTEEKREETATEKQKALETTMETPSQEMEKHKPIKKSIKINVQKEPPKPLEEKKLHKKEEDTKESLEELFLRSETDPHLKNQWMELYQKALNSDKDTWTNRKVRKGKFRITNEGKMEILPDFDTFGKSSSEILKENWRL